MIHLIRVDLIFVFMNLNFFLFKIKTNYSKMIDNDSLINENFSLKNKLQNFKEQMVKICEDSDKEYEKVLDELNNLKANQKLIKNTNIKLTKTQGKLTINYFVICFKNSATLRPCYDIINNNINFKLESDSTLYDKLFEKYENQQQVITEMQSRYIENLEKKRIEIKDLREQIQYNKDFAISQKELSAKFKNKKDLSIQKESSFLSNYEYGRTNSDFVEQYTADNYSHYIHISSVSQSSKLNITGNK